MTTETQAEFARRMGWDRSRVTQLKRAGRLVLAEDGRVDVEASQKRIEATESPDAHHRARKMSHEAERLEKSVHGSQSAQDAPGGTIHRESMEDLNHRLKKAEADKREHEADMARMERDKLAGILIAKDDVDFVLNDFGATLRTLLDNFADRYAPIIHPLQNLEEVHAALAEAAESVQAEIYETMRRRAEPSA